MSFTSTASFDNYGPTTSSTGSIYYYQYPSPTATYSNWPTSEVHVVVKQLKKSAKEHLALQQLRADLPKPAPVVPGRTKVRARHGFQQMCRLPCYRGSRVR